MDRDDQPKEGNKLQLLETEATNTKGRQASPGHSAHPEDNQVLDNEVSKMSQPSNKTKPGHSHPPSHQPGAFSCIVDKSQDQGIAVIEGERLCSKTGIAGRMEADLLRKQEGPPTPLATMAQVPPRNHVMSNLEEAIHRKQEIHSSSATISNSSVESHLLQNQGNNVDLDDLERGPTTTSSSRTTVAVPRKRSNTTRSQLDAFEATVGAKASTIPALSSLTNQFEDIMVGPICRERPIDDNSSRSSKDISDTHDETGESTRSLEAEIAPDFEGLEREHNMLVERIREMSVKEVVEAEVLPGKRRLWCSIAVAVLILIAVVITLSVTLTKENASLGAEAGEYAKCSKSAPEVDFDTSTERYIALRAIFDPANGAETFADESENNHRFRALHWLANEDPIQLSLESGANSTLHRIQQRYVLVLFYFSTQGWCWTNNLNWLTGFHECRWEHVGECVSASLIREIGMARNNLAGTLPPELGLLSSNLDRCDLAYNELTGSIPTELGQLTKLGDLSFGNNHLTGPIPKEFGHLTELFFLSLTSNNLTGPLPDEFGKLLALRELYISGNELTGTIPSGVIDLPLLERFYFHDNQFVADLDGDRLCAIEISFNFISNSSFVEVGADCTDEVVCSCCSFCCAQDECCSLKDDGTGDRLCLPRDV